MEPQIFFVDDDPDLRTLVATLAQVRCDTRCLSLADLAGMRAHKKQVLACKLAILDINLGSNQPSGLDAYGWLRAEGFRGKIVFLTGHADTHPLVERAVEMGEARLYRKPLAPEDLAEIIRGAIR
jgi:FixJ family two-component response regulator